MPVSPLVQVMACCLFGIQPLPEPTMACFQSDTKDKFQQYLNYNTNVFTPENAFENLVRKMSVVRFLLPFVNNSHDVCELICINILGKYGIYAYVQTACGYACIGSNWTHWDRATDICISELGCHHSLTHWGRVKMAAIFQTTFSNGFSWMKMHEFRLTFHWILFLVVQLTIFQHWFG